MLYSEGGAFLIEGPEGSVTDREVGDQVGTCCVYYPAGSTWDDAETVMYPSIATKRPGQRTLKEFMAVDLADFRDHNPEMTDEDGGTVMMKHGRIATVHFFYNVNKGSSEAVAYVDEEKIIAMFVVSSKTKKGLNEAMPLVRTALETYTYMDVRFAKDPKKKDNSTELPKN